MGKPISLRELAELTGKRVSLIEAQLSEITPTNKGKKDTYYYSVDALRAIYVHQKSSSESVELKDQQSQLLKARTKKVEMENKWMEQELIHIDAVGEAYEKQLLVFRQKLIAFPAKLAKQLAYETGPNKIKNILLDEIEEALKVFSYDELREEAQESDTKSLKATLSGKPGGLGRTRKKT